MSIRIVAGEFRSRILQVLESPELRPTTDRVREAIFSVVGNHVDLETARVLDLFAGTGALGLEALSRGAKSVTLVERSRKHAACIRQNIALLDVADRTIVVEGAVGAYLAASEGKQNSFDLVLCDPPYGEIPEQEFLDVLWASSMLQPGGIVVWEGAVTDDLSGHSELSRSRFLKERRYGKTFVRFYAG